MQNSAVLRAGDWVEVRSKEEILATLDQNGYLEELPFMPEMFAFCGQRFRVFKRAHKTCDPPNGIAGRRMLNAVHLESNRCGGDAHGGCQARCLIFWKEAWLKAVDGSSNRADLIQPSFLKATTQAQGKCTEADVIAGVRDSRCDSDPDGPRYICQSTQVAQATLPCTGPAQFVEDYTSRNESLFRLFSGFAFFVYEKLVTSGLGFGAPLRWLYDVFQKMRGGTPYPWRLGKVPKGTKTPSERLDLQPGELVRIRSYEEILKTLNEDGINRGMWFDAEMVPFCGKTYRVLDRVQTIVNEKTGKVLHMKNDCIMLEDVVCLACYAKHRRFCPRSIYPYWREIWLERVNPLPQ